MPPLAAQALLVRRHWLSRSLPTVLASRPRAISRAGAAPRFAITWSSPISSRWQLTPGWTVLVRMRTTLVAANRLLGADSLTRASMT
jgi:hypothetical protein